MIKHLTHLLLRLLLQISIVTTASLCRQLTITLLLDAGTCRHPLRESIDSELGPVECWGVGQGILCCLDDYPIGIVEIRASESAFMM